MSQEYQDITKIGLNQKRVVIISVTCLLLIPVFLYLVWLGILMPGSGKVPHIGERVTSFGGFVSAMGIVGVAICGSYLWALVSRSPTKEKNIILCDEGFQNNLEDFDVGMIPWFEVEEISTMYDKMVAILLADKKKYYSHAYGNLAPELYKIPVVIDAADLEISATELKRLFQSYFNKYGNKKEYANGNPIEQV